MKKQEMTPTMESMEKQGQLIPYAFQKPIRAKWMLGDRKYDDAVNTLKSGHTKIIPASEYLGYVMGNVDPVVWGISIGITLSAVVPISFCLTAWYWALLWIFGTTFVLTGIITGISYCIVRNHLALRPRWTTNTKKLVERAEKAAAQLKGLTIWQDSKNSLIKERFNLDTVVENIRELAVVADYDLFNFYSENVYDSDSFKKLEEMVQKLEKYSENTKVLDKKWRDGNQIEALMGKFKDVSSAKLDAALADNEAILGILAEEEKKQLDWQNIQEEK